MLAHRRPRQVGRRGRWRCRPWDRSARLHRVSRPSGRRRARRRLCRPICRSPRRLPPAQSRVRIRPYLLRRLRRSSLSIGVCRVSCLPARRKHPRSLRPRPAAHPQRRQPPRPMAAVRSRACWCRHRLRPPRRSACRTHASCCRGAPLSTARSRLRLTPRCRA